MFPVTLYWRNNICLIIITLFLLTSCEERQSEKNSISSTLSNHLSEHNIHFHSLNSTEETGNDSITIILSSVNDTSNNSSEDECPDLECQLVLLDTTEYNILDDGRIHAHKHNIVFEKCEFFDLGNAVAVCQSKLIPTPSDETDNNRILATITMLGLSTSVLFIILHLVVFLFLPEMKNLPGCCLASLCVALVLAYVNFLIAITVNNLSKTSCIGVAISMYYFFMASFFWMNVIAFDVWRSLKAATKKLKVMENKLPKRRFFFYSLYAWLIPMSLAILTHQIDSSDHIPHKYRPRFADGETRMCLFKETHSLLLLFIIPLVVLMCLNILLFGISAYIIVTASFHSSKDYKKVLVTKFFVFLRLALMMGLTWVSAILVNFTDYTFMRYVFVISNAFQGLFIFLAFSCKTTVKRNFFRRMSTFSSRTSSRTNGFFFKSNSSSSVRRERFRAAPIPGEMRVQLHA